MADDGMTALSEKLVPLLREYDLPDSIMALSFQLTSAVNLAGKATKMGRELRLALEYAEQKTFWTNDAIKKILRA
jgi:hypothetical protein